MKREELEKAIRNYLGHNLRALSLVNYDGIFDVELSYEDGPSVNEVRNHILGLSSNILNISISRIYSRRVVAEALMALYEDDDALSVRLESLLFSEDLSCPVQELADRN